MNENPTCGLDKSQIVNNVNSLEQKGNFLKSGKFAKGNRVSVGNKAGKGFAKISTRMAILANKYSREEIDAIVKDEKEFGKRMMADRIAIKRVLKAEEGDRGDADFLLDRIEGKVSNKTELTGKDGNPLAVATADVTNLILEISEEVAQQKGAR